MSTFRAASRALLFAALLPTIPLVIAGTQALAQSDTSSISGTVTDPSGAVVPNAKVTARNEATGQTRNVTTNSVGAYTLTNIPSGSYTVTVESQGFQTAVQQGMHVDPSIGAQVNVSLKSGSTSTTVTVQANANRLQTESASVGQLVTAQQVQSIQLNGRNPLYLSQLEPGVTRNAPMSSFNFSLDNTLYVNGSRSQENILTFDGAPMVRTRSNNNSVGVADVDATSQVQILTTGYQAEYGRTSGGQVRLIPKSGTNVFHGAVFEYLRNSFFNANTWQRNNSPDPLIAGHPEAFRYNQFGWNLNGPVYIPGHFNTSRQKLFFLVGQEYVRYRRSPTQTGKVPTLAMRSGNFGELLGPNIFYSKPVQIVNPRTGAAYPGNIIPPSDLSPNGLALLNAFPAPNVNNNSAYNWQEARANPQDQRKDTLVVDYVPAEAHRIRLSILSYHLDYITPFAGNFDRTPEKWHWPNQAAALHYTWAISPSMVNEASVTGTADHITISYDLSSGLYDRTRYGINFPFLYPASEKVIPNKIPTINLANFTTLDGGPYPSHSGGPVIDVSDNLTKVIGNHTFKVGGLWEYAGENNYDQISVSSTTPGSTNNQDGQFRFTDTRNGFPTSGVAVANAALGLFDTYGEIGTKSYTLFRGNMYEGFVQDTWRAKPNMVIEAGARYSVMRPYYALWGNQSFFDPAAWNPANAPVIDPVSGVATGGNLYNGVVIPGTHFPSSAQGHVPAEILANPQASFTGKNPGYSNTIWTDIQPRFGVTYQVRPNTVVRAGAGRYVQRLGISDQVQLGGNAPFQPTTFVSGGVVDNPAGTTGGALPRLPLSMTTQPYDFPNPNAWSWNAAIEQDVPSFATFTLAYVGRRGLHLQQMEQLNQLHPGTVQANPGVTTDALRPYRGFSSILQIDNHGSSIYHSLQANLNRRLSHGLLFGVAYTWSKSMDYGSDQSYQLPDIYNPKANWGPSDFDIRNTLVINYVWDIPYGRNFENRFVKGTLGNWELSGTTQAQSGEPLTVSTNDDFAGVGAGAGPQRWDMMATPGKPHQFGGAGQTGYWFQPTVFTQPGAGTEAPRGTRNVIYNPGFQSWNIALQKGFHVIPGHDNHLLTFRAEAFNFTNHPNWDDADSNPTSGTFGEVTTKGSTYASDRQLQFSLRYAF
ncbi:MAG: carboxypeptidase regulatory-like domain-containing protein [Acidobacteriaceae bacterium]